MCDCSTNMNVELAKSNGRLATGFFLDNRKMKVLPPMIAVEQIEAGRGKKKPPAVLATFCPFCGGRIESEDA